MNVTRNGRLVLAFIFQFNLTRSFVVNCSTYIGGWFIFTGFIFIYLNLPEIVSL